MPRQVACATVALSVASALEPETWPCPMQGLTVGATHFDQCQRLDGGKLVDIQRLKPVTPPVLRAVARACMVGKSMETSGVTPAAEPSLVPPSFVPWYLPTQNWSICAPAFMKADAPRNRETGWSDTIQ